MVVCSRKLEVKTKQHSEDKVCKMGQNLSEEESFQFCFKVKGEEKRKVLEKKNASKEL